MHKQFWYEIWMVPKSIKTCLCFSAPYSISKLFKLVENKHATHLPRLLVSSSLNKHLLPFSFPITNRSKMETILRECKQWNSYQFISKQNRQKAFVFVFLICVGIYLFSPKFRRRECWSECYISTDVAALWQHRMQFQPKLGLGKIFSCPNCWRFSQSKLIAISPEIWHW